MREKVLSKFKKIINEPLFSLGRAGDIVWFHFGKPINVKNQRGQEMEIGTYRLHIQSSWRFIHRAEILLAYQDIFEPGSKYLGKPQDYYYDDGPYSLFEDHAEKLYESFFPLKVIKVSTNELGDMEIYFSNDCILQIIIDSSSDKDVEYWRLISMEKNRNSHFVMASTGIEDDE